MRADGYSGRLPILVPARANQITGTDESTGTICCRTRFVFQRDIVCRRVRTKSSRIVQINFTDTKTNSGTDEPASLEGPPQCTDAVTILSSPATRENRIEHSTTKNTMRAAVRGLSMLALPWRTGAEPEGSTAALPWTNRTTSGEGKAPALHTTPAVDVASEGRFLLHDIRVCPLLGGDKI